MPSCTRGSTPVTGREHRSWHPAGTVRADAERLAARLARERNGRNDPTRSMTFGVFLTTRWLPGKRVCSPTAPTMATAATSNATSVAAGRAGSRRDRHPRLDPHRRRRPAEPSPRHLAGVRAHRPTRQGAGHPSARPAPHPRHPVDQSRCAGEGRERTSRPRHAIVHDRDLPARATRDASRRRPNLPATPRVTASTDTDHPGEDPVEAPREDHRTTVEALADLIDLPGLLWWRG
jgi:hypothetical protein